MDELSELLRCGMSDRRERRGRFHVKRTVYEHSPETCHVTASIAVEDFPQDPKEVAAMFTGFPDGARCFEDPDNRGWVDVEWKEPSTDADRASLEEVLFDKRLAAEFVAWRKAQVSGGEHAVDEAVDGGEGEADGVG